MNAVYIPKFKAKCFASYLYTDNEDNHSNYHAVINKDNLFKDGKRDPNQVILGIESTYDESAAAILNSYG